MDSNRLRYFLAVNQTGSIRKAAEILNLSPAALSKAIKQLEDEAGAVLLMPSGRGISITPAGKELARQAQPVVDGLKKLARDFKERTNLQLQNQPTIRIGSFEVFTTYFLSELTKVFPPDFNLLLREVIPGEMEQALLDHAIDYGITYIPIPTAGVDHQQIAKIEMGAFAVEKFFSGKKFEDVPFVIPIQPLEGSPNKVQGLDGWPDDKVFRHIKFRVTLMESALELCRQGFAAAYLPVFIADLHNNTVRPKHQLHPLSLPASMKSRFQGVFLARRKNEPENEVHRKMARALRSISR